MEVVQGRKRAAMGAVAGVGLDGIFDAEQGNVTAFGRMLSRRKPSHSREHVPFGRSYCAKSYLTLGLQVLVYKALRGGSVCRNSFSYWQAYILSDCYT